MLFNSLDFAIFLPCAFILYWNVFNRNLRLQNLFLLGASYLFYGWWDWRFLTLIAISSLCDYQIGKHLIATKKAAHRKLLLYISLSVNLGLLGVCKYYNFFIHSFADLLQTFNLAVNVSSLHIILPIGISFYTFQSLSYTIDIYRNQGKATNDWVAFFAFVSFFPQLVAGPIERASNLLPQFESSRQFDYDKARDGLRQILWGLFKKVVIADTCAPYVDYTFSNYQQLDGSQLFLGAFYFAFQIYGDFSGYSDIAVGTARLFGFDLMLNFKLPYFSRDFGEFWKRWHISLSTWFRDYVYIPLGGSFGSNYQHFRNIMITFTVSGLWHGANWNFVLWGFLNGLYYLPTFLRKKSQSPIQIIAHGSLLPPIREATQVLITFLLTLLAWIFFRAESVSHAISYIERMISNNLFSLPLEHDRNILALIVTLLTIEWIQRKKEHCLQIDNLKRGFRWMIYLLTSIMILSSFEHERSFIYFQF